MLKVLKRIGIALIGLVCLVCAGIGAYWFWGDRPNADRALAAKTYDKAIALYDKELAQGFWPGRYHYHMLEQRALADYELNDSDKAMLDYSAALKLEPNSVPMLVRRAITYFGKMDWSATLRDFDAANAAYPNNPNVLYARAQIYDATLDFDDAIADYHAVRTPTPSLTDAYEREAYNLAHKGETEMASKVISEIPINSSYDAKAFM